MEGCLISIIMGIYNCADTLPEAIESIIHQSYQNWELIMCDDGSIDDTYDVAVRYQKDFPEKIVLLRNDENLGLNKTLNHCLQHAKGTYIARMDGDDISLPERLQKELEELQKNPGFAIISSDMLFFDETGVWGRTNKTRYPQPKDMVTVTPHCHAPSLVKKEAFDAVGGYSVGKKYLRVEDRDLWYKMYAAGYRGMNISTPLYMMRDDQNAIKRKKYKDRINGFKVGLRVIDTFSLSPIYYVKALRPLIIGLVPKFIYKKMHKNRLEKNINSAE